MGQPLPAVKAEAQLLSAGYGGAASGLAPAASAPAAAPPQLMDQRLAAYSKVMKIFMQGSYDLVGMRCCATWLRAGQMVLFDVDA